MKTVQKIALAFICLAILPACEESYQLEEEENILATNHLPVNIYVLQDEKLYHLEGSADHSLSEDFRQVSFTTLRDDGYTYDHGTPVFDNEDNNMYLAQGERVYKFKINSQTLDPEFEWEFDTRADIYADPFIMDRDPQLQFSESIFIGNDEGDFYCLDDDGNEIWKFSTASGAKIRSSACGNTFFSFSQGLNPIVFFGADDGYLYAVSALYGTELWKYYTGSLVRTSPLLYPYDEFINADVENPGSIVVGNNEGFVYSLNPWNGELQWQYDSGALTQSSPAHFNNRVYIGNSQGKLFCFSSGGLEWDFQAGAAIASSPYCQWFNNDVRIFFTSTDGFLYAIDGQGNLVWRTNIKEGELLGRGSPVTIENDIVYISTTTHVFGISIEDGSILSRYAVTGTGQGSPTILTGIQYGNERVIKTYHSSVLGNKN